jgi:hypothetical protein
MKITTEWLREKHACEKGSEWFENQFEADGATLVRTLAVDHWDWANWLLVRIMTRPQYLAYAIYAAEQVIEIYERRNPGNAAPRRAIEAARAVLDNDNAETRKAASAAYAAYAAYAYAAYAAYAAAAAAAYASAYAYAAYAAAAAADYAYAAHAAYAAADARAKMRARILPYGLALIEKETAK